MHLLLIIPIILGPFVHTFNVSSISLCAYEHNMHIYWYFFTKSFPHVSYDCRPPLTFQFWSVFLDPFLWQASHKSIPCEYLMSHAHHFLIGVLYPYSWRCWEIESLVLDICSSFFSDAHRGTFLNSVMFHISFYFLIKKYPQFSYFFKSVWVNIISYCWDQ